MEEQVRKRPIFTPIVLLLLTISLTGNVFLYTKSIQSNQDKLAERGFAIIDSVAQTKEHINSVLMNAQDLLDHEDISKRLAAKSALLAAFNGQRDFVRLIHEAEITNGSPLVDASKRDTAAFLEQVKKSLQEIGNHEGQLGQGEQVYLKQLIDLYSQLKSTVDQIHYTSGSRTTALTVLVDPKWVNAGKEALEIMNEPADVRYNP